MTVKAYYQLQSDNNVCFQLQYNLAQTRILVRQDNKVVSGIKEKVFIKIQ